ncbi:MAG: (d)CMP kinase [Clostridia bacterium]|nr:(d)CMP kinase [Clostridia bacterium]
MINVALDGPSGAGKSTIAKAVARTFDYIYIDTGAMFRSLAFKALESGIDIASDYEAVEKMLRETVLDIARENGEQQMILDGQNVNAFIRTPEVSKAASDIAVIPFVRQWLLKTERMFAEKYNCIMDGRDIGTSVLPNADVKIFLTASAEARAKRRLAELVEKGVEVSFDEVLAEMQYRDKQDSEREISPLKKAHDAHIADTTELTLDESVNLVCDIIRKVIG